MPQWVRDAIRENFIDLAERDYWREIQQATSERIQDIIGKGLADGINGRELAKTLEETFSGLSKSSPASEQSPPRFQANAVRLLS